MWLSKVAQLVVVYPWPRDNIDKCVFGGLLAWEGAQVDPISKPYTYICLQIARSVCSF
jgi:hypothetical protein